MRAIALVAALPALLTLSAANADEPLSSWNDNKAKQSIIDFVEQATTEGSEGFVPRAERIATFDNDGCLWSEKPIYVQLVFAVDRIKQLADAHPEWQDEEPFKSVLAGDLESLKKLGKPGLAKIIAATHSGLSVDEYRTIVKDWISTARHPETGLLYTEMAYQPMVELLDYLRANGFKTYIVTGGGVEFVRAWCEGIYGIPPEQVVGSREKYKFEFRDGKPTLMKLPEIDLIDDGPGKPVGIEQVIGRRPVIAGGNSDGDLQMLEWAAISDQPGLAILIHHTDAKRESAYDRNSAIGRLDKALDEAREKGWAVVSMKDDWKTIYVGKSE